VDQILTIVQCSTPGLAVITQVQKTLLRLCGHLVAAFHLVFKKKPEYPTKIFNEEAKNIPYSKLENDMHRKPI
jgi:hypothetical protein